MAYRWLRQIETIWLLCPQCIDGYSRRILWLEVASSNNDPKLVAQYYLDYVRQSSATRRIVRGDRETENVNVAAIQRFYRRDSEDEFSGEKSFIYGRSTANQRIEAWWGRLRDRDAQTGGQSILKI